MSRENTDPLGIIGCVMATQVALLCSLVCTWKGRFPNAVAAVKSLIRINHITEFDLALNGVFVYRNGTCAVQGLILDAKASASPQLIWFVESTPVDANIIWV